MRKFSTVSSGKPHTSGTGWHIELSCGHSVWMFHAPTLGQINECQACTRNDEERDEEEEALAAGVTWRGRTCGADCGYCGACT